LPAAIAARLGVSDERVRQIEIQALAEIAGCQRLELSG